MFKRGGAWGTIWHIAVHPDFRSLGIGKQLLQESEKLAKERGLNRLEAWTRDDIWVNRWYEKNEFIKVDSYLHVIMSGKQEVEDVLESKYPNLYAIQAFAHYTGEDKEWVKEKFERVHDCYCYEKRLR